MDSQGKASYDYIFKFIVIGDTGVGKSCIVLQFIENKTRTTHDITIGVQFGAKTIQVKNKTIKLKVWDTAGQQNFRSITRSYYRSSIGALLVYDVTRRNTLTHVKNWLQQVKNNGNPHMQILLVGNKNDLKDQRVVSYEEGQKIAMENGLNFIEINSMNTTIVEEAFHKIAQTILLKVQNNAIPINQSIGVQIGDHASKNILSDAKKKKQQKKGCC